MQTSWETMVIGGGDSPVRPRRDQDEVGRAQVSVEDEVHPPLARASLHMRLEARTLLY